MWNQRNRFLLSSLSHLRYISSTSLLSHLRPLKPSPCIYPYNSFLPPIDSQGRNHLLDLPAGTISRNLTSSNSCSSCWNCGTAGPKSGPFLACGSCGAVQPVDTSVDYFHIFGIKKMYDIKEEDLEGIYKNWQKKLHPDLVHSKSEKEKAFAAEQSARVIDAYRTLKKPLSRALYLLKLEGVHVDEEKTISDPNLLIEMMEMREAVEDAKDSKSLYEIQSQVWSHAERILNTGLLVRGESVQNIWDRSNLGLRSTGKEKVLALIAICWAIWKQRNARIFARKSLRPEMIAGWAAQEAKSWGALC